MPAPYVSAFSGPYKPAGSSTDIWSFLVTVTTVATRLYDLIVTAGGTIPTVAGRGGRYPDHVRFQVPAAAANPVYMTSDNNTAPVVGGPGDELNPGVVWKFDLANSLLTPQTDTEFPTDAKSAFQFIAAGNTSLLVTFADSDLGA